MTGYFSLEYRQKPETY